MVQALRNLSESGLFQHGITAVILAAGVVVGLETSAEIRAEHGPFLEFANALILAIYPRQGPRSPCCSL